MSVDFEVWSVERPGGTAALPRQAEWQAAVGGRRYAGKGWQIVIDEPVAVDEADIPPNIGPHLVGVSYLTRVTLEPGHAPKPAQSMVRLVVHTLATSCHGVVFDSQEGVVTGASGQQRKFSPAKDEPVELLTLNWWFTDGPLITRDGARALIAYFQNYLPQFLPRRYGDFEPPRFAFDAADIEPFLDFVLRERSLSAAWSCAGRLFDVHYSPRSGPGWKWRPGLGGYVFDVPSLRLSCPLQLVDEPGWEGGTPAMLESRDETGTAVLR